MTAMDNDPFELPTDPGAGIAATWTAGKWAGQETEMRLYSDGYWRNTHSAAPDTPEWVLKHFSGFRVLDPDAAPTDEAR